jgi:hypothetical protein
MRQAWIAKWLREFFDQECYLKRHHSRKKLGETTLKALTFPWVRMFGHPTLAPTLMSQRFITLAQGDLFQCLVELPDVDGLEETMVESGSPGRFTIVCPTITGERDKYRACRRWCRSWSFGQFAPVHPRQANVAYEDLCRMVMAAISALPAFSMTITWWPPASGSAASD